MTKQQQVKAAKLLVLVRYSVKRAATINGVHYPVGCIVLKVRNGEGREYFVTLRRNKIHHCTCPHISSKKCAECYHIQHTKELENARADAARRIHQALDILAEERKETRKDTLRTQEGLVQAPNGMWVTPEQLANVPGAPRATYESARKQAGYGEGVQATENRLRRAGLMRR